MLLKMFERFRATPKHLEALLRLAELAVSRSEPDKAIELYTQIVRLNPGHATAYYKRGNLLRDREQWETALADYNQAIELNPCYANAFCNRGVILAVLNRLQEALDSYEQAIVFNPTDALAHFNRAAVLRDLKRPQDALDSYGQAIAAKPDYVECHYNRSLLQMEMKQWNAALSSLDAAIAIKPDFAEAYCNRGNVLVELKQHEAALEYFGRAIALKSAYPAALNNRANILYFMRKFSAALESFDKAIELQLDFPEAYIGRGMCLQHLGQYATAIASFNRALELNPDQRHLLGVRRHAQMQICDWSGLTLDLEHLVEGLTANRAISAPFAMLALVDSPPLHRLAAEAWVREECPADDFLGAIEVRPRSHKIHVGYFSADFRDHPVSLLSAGLFELHDRSRFDITAFAFGSETQDAVRMRLERAFDRFIDVRGLADIEVARLARKMGIDIAVDLGGFTENARTKIFALRAAPIQVGYLGYLGTMGVAYMDYLVADEVVIPTAQQRHYSEKIIYLPSYQVNDMKRRVAERTFTREELGLPVRGFVFCCFNANYKITPTTFNVWMQILKRVDSSSLFLFSDNKLAEENLKKAAQNCGVDSYRIVFGARLAREDYLARLRAMDLFLDTLPYNAGTTASDALWVGLPVLTCMGEALAGRVAASVLRAVHLPELITVTPEQYEELAVRLATDPELCAKIRIKLAGNRALAPLFDTASFTKNLEYAFGKIYERHHDLLAPEHIYPEL